YEFREGKVKEYLGDIDYYLESRAAQDFREVEKRTPVNKNLPKNDTKQLDGVARRERKSLKNRLSKIEREIEQIEGELLKMDAELINEYTNTEVPEVFFSSYEKLKNRLKILNEEWEIIYRELES